MPSRATPTAARAIISTLAARGQTIVTIESCTGGLIAGALTAIPGSSAAIYGGYVTYANAAKTAMTGVSPALIEKYGAVSEEVARAMALGGLARTGADFSIAVTGIAGPSGGSAEKPVGLVHFAIASRHGVSVLVQRFGDRGREAVRQAAVLAALNLVIEALRPLPEDQAP
jgi:nicotinamide-nucleotide amidase